MLKEERNNMESGYYPPGAEHDINAPYNQVNQSEKEVEITVSITLSKTIRVKVTDYKIENYGKNEDGDYFEDIDFSECNFQDAVKQQVVLPQDAYNYIKPNTKEEVQAYLDLIDWHVDEIEYIVDN